MTLQPRIPPIEDDALSPEQRAALEPLREDGTVLNIFRVMAHSPSALERYRAWGGYVLSRRNRLTPRLRELVILRVGALCAAPYEVAQHTLIARNEGVSNAEIVAALNVASLWSPAETSLFDAAEQLVRHHALDEETWARLRTHWSERECMDFVFTVAQYVQTSIILNAFQVPLEPETRAALEGGS